MADDALTRKDAEMGRLTREEIELWRKICESHWVTDTEGVFLSHAESARQANTLCDLALRALSLESVREEVLAKHKSAVLEEIAFVCNVYANEGNRSGKEYVYDTVAELTARIRALQHAPARVAEGEPFPVELMSHSMDDDKRFMARKILKLQRVEKAYCAANDYINALANASVTAESLEKIRDAYWQAVREVQ